MVFGTISGKPAEAAPSPPLEGLSERREVLPKLSLQAWLVTVEQRDRTSVVRGSVFLFVFGRLAYEPVANREESYVISSSKSG